MFPKRDIKSGPKKYMTTVICDDIYIFFIIYIQIVIDMITVCIYIYIYLYLCTYNSSTSPEFSPFCCTDLVSRQAAVLWPRGGGLSAIAEAATSQWFQKLTENHRNLRKNRIDRD